MTYTFSTNLKCQGCADNLSDAFKSKGIYDFKIDVNDENKWVQINSNAESVDTLQKIIEEAGYSCSLNSENIKIEVPSFWNDKPKWKRAGLNTVNCLIGCSLGDFGMIFFLQNYYPNMNMWYMMSLAMISGLTTSVLLETFILKIKEGFQLNKAFTTAMSMSFISMLVMESAENITDVVLTGGQYNMHQPFYWVAFGISMIAGFFVPLPYNYYKLKKYGKSCH